MKTLNSLLALLFGAMIIVNAQGQTTRIGGELLLQLEKGVLIESLESDYETYSLSKGELLSAPMNIYRFYFNENSSADLLLRELREDDRISLAQFNHHVKQRCQEINDPDYDSQWHHDNIDTDLAWGLTKGGVTAAGDTIVVCIIEGGNLNHPDLQPNAWVNNQEIPGNGIDDDNNGYVDDYLGWNVNSEDDQGVLQGGHGTSVMGMIGAQGGNELGMIGANWDVKMMSVAGESLFDEASVVEAYTYPLVMRQRYIATEGDSGAFVVATNASWGIDNGNIEDVPIWSAFYDTLGTYGILNCGATANNNVDIDAVGDIPTAAPSDYMISVTATNVNDLRTFSAYGLTTVDFGAPGENVATTAGQNGYTFTSGTSFASPLTAGVIALLYSAPCEAFANFIRENPQEGADLVRQALFDGVDVIPNLVGETVTGGRINAFNSLILLMEGCEDEEICLPPVGFESELESDTVYTFNWVDLGETGATVRFKPIGSENWNVLENIEGGSITIDTLARCTTYEFEIGSTCEENGEVSYSSCLTVSTLGCCLNPETFVADEIQETETEVTWSTDFGIDSYNLFYRVLGEDEWILYGNYSDTAATLLEGLELCTEYELLINPGCAEEPTEGTTFEFRTKGCGACLDNVYCESSSEISDEEFIQTVELGDYILETGNNGGYAFFEDFDIVLERGAGYYTILTPGFTDEPFSEFFKLWIDLNQDGEFSDSDELLLSSEEGSSDPVEGEVLIPDSAELGSTRMRVSMKFVGGPFIPDNIEACENYTWGETEDYCVTINLPTSTQNVATLDDFSLYPNPANDLLNIDFTAPNPSEVYTLRIFDSTAKSILNELFTPGLHSMDISNLTEGLYIYQMINNDGVVVKSGKVVKTD